MKMLKRNELVELIKQHDADKGVRTDCYNWQDKTANHILEALAKALNYDFKYEIKDGFLIDLEEKDKDLQQYWLEYTIYSNGEDEVCLTNSEYTHWTLEDGIIENNDEKGICLI